jgi:Uma2 family endonuclease
MRQQSAPRRTTGKADAQRTGGSSIGPHAHGSPMSLDDFMAADHEEGYQYELIDGELYVSPQADLPQESVDEWIYAKLLFYSLQHPEVINRVSAKARVFVPGRSRTTAPEPDCACYQNFPKDTPFEKLRWQDVSPILVVEVLSKQDPDKDLVRNVKLYLQVPTIQEYWILDASADADRPKLLVQRRRGKRWHKRKIPFGGMYTTTLLPGFALIVDPHT